MKNKSLIIGFLLLMLSALSFSQTSWYVSQQTGSDSNNGLNPDHPFNTIETAVNYLSPGDTLFIIGEYTNQSYNPDYTFEGDINDPHIWLLENAIKITELHGNANGYITIKAFDENTVIKGDGSNIIRITLSSYLRIENLEVFGEVGNIPLSTALALQFLYKDPATDEVLYRVPPGTSDEEVANMTFPVLEDVHRPSYTDTRGIYFTGVHHIDIINNTIHHTPGGGLRVAKGEYINIIGNEIHDCSRRSYSGTHALVVTKSESSDSSDEYKINIQQNEVHHNYNEIYSWAPGKSFITPRIDEGKGISLQRNNSSGWTHGRILVANNICYWNGYSGVHTNAGKRIDFINNTCYMNSYTSTITYANEEQGGHNIGISSQSSDDIKIINNIIFIDNEWGGYAISAGNSNNLQVMDNIIYGINGSINQDNDITSIQVNTMITDPLFNKPNDFDFHLSENSPAIGVANTNYTPSHDFYGNIRDDNPDLGAIEYLGTAVVSEFNHTAFNVYPNPFRNRINIQGNKNIRNLKIFSMSGQQIEYQVNDHHSNISIDVSRLAKGTYILKINDEIKQIIKE